MDDTATSSATEQVPEFTLVRSGRGAAGKLLRVPRGYMTSGMIQEMLGISAHQFRSMTQTGVIARAKRNARGWALYLESDVRALNRNQIPGTVSESGATHRRDRPDLLLPATFSAGTVYSAEECKQVFALLVAGVDLVAIVLQTGLHSAVVQAIARDYVALSGCLFLDARTVEAINALPLEGTLPVRTAAELLAVIRTAARAPSCATRDCRRPPARHCVHCVAAGIAAQAKKQAKARSASEEAG